MTFALRPYQVEAEAALNLHICTKETNPCVVLPTGSGKSVSMASIIRKWHGDAPHVRGCILAHRKELVQQNAEKLNVLYPEGNVGIFSAGLGKRDYDSPLLFASIDSVFKRAGEFPPFDFIFVDEAHRIPPSGEGKYRTFINECKKFNSALRVVGWTATPFRMGCGPICHKDHVLQEICYEAKITDLIDQGYLSNLRSKVSKTQPDLSEVKRNCDGDYIVKSLSEATNKMGLISQAIEEAVGRMLAEKRKSAIFFCVDVEHCERVSKELAAWNIVAPVVVGKTLRKKRDKIIRDFKAKHLGAVCCVNVLTEGFDAPHIDCIVLLRPTLSAGLFCLDFETEILARDGWRGIGEIKEGDMIAGFDTSDESIKYVEAIATSTRVASGAENFVSIETPSTSIRVTENHRMVIGTRKDRKWRIETARRVSSRKSGVMLSKAGEISVPGAKLTDDELRFIGWVMTDGNINKTTNGITIYQSVHQPWVREIDRVLMACGMKFSVTDETRSTNFNDSSTIRRWTISKGKPRGEKKHLRGWGALEPWLSKDFSEKLLEEISAEQFPMLLEAIHLGDGAKQLRQNWTRRSYHISTGNKVFADRLQICAVTRGFRSTVSFHTYNKGPLWVVHIKKIKFANVGSTHDGRPGWEVNPCNGEKVWCVQNKLGTIVTRRNGKVTIVGNSQMVGRGLRISPDKRDCIVLDFAGCIEEHGPVDLLGTGLETIMAVCVECRESFSRATRSCPICGWVIPPREMERMEAEEKERRMHAAMPSKKSVLSHQPEIHLVNGVTVSRHVKAGAPDSLRVQYRCGYAMFREWICLDHDGYAGQKAQTWWYERFGRVTASNGVAQVPTVNDATSNLLTSQTILDCTKSITVRQNGKFKEIIGYNQPITEEPKA